MYIHKRIHTYTNYQYIHTYIHQHYLFNTYIHTHLYKSGPSYSPISDTEQDINVSHTYLGIDAAKILWHIKTKSGKIPFEGTREQMAFLSQPQQPQKVSHL